MDFDYKRWEGVELTRDILLEEFYRIEKEDPESFDIKRCEICGQPSSVHIYESEFFGTFYSIDSVKHKNCIKIAKYEKLSIFDKSHKENTFENSKPTNEKEKRYLDSFKKYCDNFEKAKKLGVGLLLTGKAGTGKTFCSNCISNELKAQGNSVLSFNLSGYLQEIRKGFDEKENQLIEAIKSVDLIIIDDVGSENISDWGKEKMFNLFNEIYLNKKSCIITTNNNAKELGEHLKINGSNKILDRLLELCKPFKFDWESKRKNIGEEKFKNIFN